MSRKDRYNAIVVYAHIYISGITRGYINYTILYSKITHTQEFGSKRGILLPFFFFFFSVRKGIPKKNSEQRQQHELCCGSGNSTSSKKRRRTHDVWLRKLLFNPVIFSKTVTQTLFFTWYFHNYTNTCRLSFYGVIVNSQTILLSLPLFCYYWKLCTLFTYTGLP